MAYQTFQQEYMQIPPITRAYSTACVLTTIAVQLDLVTPFRLYFNPTLIFKQLQFWRLVTNFMFFGTVGKVGLWGYGQMPAVALPFTAIIYHCLFRIQFSVQYDLHVSLLSDAWREFLSWADIRLLFHVPLRGHHYDIPRCLYESSEWIYLIGLTIN